MLEYDRATPVALIEYKHKNTSRCVDDLQRSANYKAIINLANAAGLPIFEVRWRDDFAVFQVTPLNHFARTFYLSYQKNFAAAEYKLFLRSLRSLPSSKNNNFREHNAPKPQILKVA